MAMQLRKVDNTQFLYSILRPLDIYTLWASPPPPSKLSSELCGETGECHSLCRNSVLPTSVLLLPEGAKVVRQSLEPRLPWMPITAPLQCPGRQGRAGLPSEGICNLESRILPLKE